MLAALCLAAVFAISLTSYLTMCYTSLSVSTRNLMFNHGTELAEAGAEFGLYALNYDTNTGGSTNPWTSPTWTVSGTTATANLTMTSDGLVATSSAPTPLNYGNGMNGTVTVTVTNYNSSVVGTLPVVEAQANMVLPGYAGSTSGTTVSQSVAYSGYLSSINSASLVSGNSYVVGIPGTTEWTSVGASSNLQGTAFTATGSTTGTGIAFNTGPLSGASPLFVNAVVGTYGDAPTQGRVAFQAAGTVDSYNSVIGAASIVSGQTYTICSVGTTNWTSIGASANTTGTSFVATGSGTGTGTAYAAYDSVHNHGYSAVIASLDTASTTATVKLMDANVSGYAVGYDYLNPTTTNWLSYGSTGTVVGPTTPPATYIDSSRLITESSPYQPIYLELPTSKYPYSSASSTLPATISTSNWPYYNTLLNIGGTQGSVTLGNTTQTVPLIYEAGSGISLTNGNIVTIEGPVILISYGGLSTSGNGTNGGGGFVLDSPQASLQIFVEYGNITLGGSTGITYSNNYITSHPNQLLPKKVAIMATNNNFSTAKITQTSAFYGVLYVPYMPVTVQMTGSASPPYYAGCIFGSIVGSSVTFSTGYTPIIHYDLALRSPTTTFVPGIPLQSGAAFNNLSTPFSFGSRAAPIQ